MADEKTDTKIPELKFASAKDMAAKLPGKTYDAKLVVAGGVIVVPVRYVPRREFEALEEKHKRPSDEGVPVDDKGEYKVDSAEYKAWLVKMQDYLKVFKPAVVAIGTGLSDDEMKSLPADVFEGLYEIIVTNGQTLKNEYRRQLNF